MSGRSRHFQDFRGLHRSSMLTRVEKPIFTKPTNGNGQSSPAEVLQSELHLPRPDEPFPYLENIMVAAKKYPYAAIGVMISIAAVVISAVTVLAVSIGGGMFLMYGEMKANTALLKTSLDQQVAIEGQVKVVKTIAQATLARQDFMTGLMTKEQQERVNAYDRTNPRTPAPEESAKPTN